MFMRRILARAGGLLTLGFALLFLVTLLSCTSDPILNPRNVDPEDEASQDDSEEDPNQGGGEGGLSSAYSLQDLPGNMVVLG